MTTSSDLVMRAALVEALAPAYDEAIQAIFAELARGRIPSRESRYSDYSVRDNGLSSLGNGYCRRRAGIFGAP